MAGPRETRTPEFLALNPRGKAPVLVDKDGTVLFESLAILAYLEAVYPHPHPLLPPPTTERAVFAAVSARTQESNNLIDAYEDMELIFEMRKGAAPLDADRNSNLILAIRSALDATKAELAFWEEYAGRTDFIASDKMSLADCAFYPVLAYLVHRGLALDNLPNLAAYWASVRARDSAVMSHPLKWAFDGPSTSFSVFQACADL